VEETAKIKRQNSRRSILDSGFSSRGEAGFRDIEYLVSSIEHLFVVD